jgi:hypothetical protein
VIVVKGKEVEYDLVRRLLASGDGIALAIDRAKVAAERLKQAGIVQEVDEDQQLQG